MEGLTDPGPSGGCFAARYPARLMARTQALPMTA